MTEESQTVPNLVRISIHLPACLNAGIDFVESTHSRQDTISELKEALAGTSQLNQVTNYSLVYKDFKFTEKLDDFATLDEVFPEGVTEAKINMVEKPYNLKAVYDHLSRFRENIGLNFLDSASKSFGAGVGASSFSSVGLKDVEPKEKSESTAETIDGEATEAGEGKSEKSSDDESSQKPAEEVIFSEDDVSAIKDLAAKILEESSAELKAISVLDKWILPIKSLTLSQWNPVPQKQQLKGDLLYLTLTTLESETFAITCHALGFFVSRISGSNFNPILKQNEKGVSHKSYILSHLISALSPKFSATLESNKSALYEASQFTESFLIPSQVMNRYPWAVTEEQLQQTQIPDFSRSQLPVFSNGVDGADIVKDWNDEFQGIKEFSRETFQERLLRDKLLNKYIQEFNQVATSTAIDIIKGNLIPLNPNEEPKKHIYLRNNIFYSYGVNATGSHDLTGGDEAARYCFGKDLNSIKLVNRVDAGGACTLLSCVIDYLGERVVCQAPVPGIFSEQIDKDGQPIDKVSYGYFLESDEIKIDSSMEESLQPMAEAFHLKAHSLELASGASTPGDAKLLLSKDTKGIRGTDGRTYVIDLYRTTPIDVNFLEAHYDASSADSYPHKEASIRHEAVEEWHKRKAAALFKAKTEELEKEGALEPKDGDEKPQIAIPYNEIVFNPDAFLGVKDSEEDREIVREIGSLVTKFLIPESLEDISKNTVPVDGLQLTDFLHKRGINMRYLGEIATKAMDLISEFKAETQKEIEINERKVEELKVKAQMEKKENEGKENSEATTDKKAEGEKKEESTSAKLNPVVSTLLALHRLTVQEIIVRGIKHVLRKEGQQVPFILKPYFVAHIHNCLLGSDVTSTPSVEISSDIRNLFTSEELSFISLNTLAVKLLVEREVLTRFRFTLPENWLSDLKKPLVLREIAQKFGFQWKAQDYIYEKKLFEQINQPVETTKEQIVPKGKKKKSTTQAVSEPIVRSTTFVAEDIIAFVPVIKDSSYRCSLVDEVFETARIQLLQGDKKLGLDLCLEFVGFYQQIYGSVHSETADAYSAVAQLYADNGLYTEACLFSRKTIILNERVRGLDSYETINSYIKASIYEALNKNTRNSFLLNAKSFSLWSAVYGKDHPNTLNTLTTCASILESAKLHEEAQKCHEQAIELSVKINGDLSDITGVMRFRYAVFFYQIGLFDKALENFTAASKVFAKLLGPEDTLTKECLTFVLTIRRYLEYTQLEKEKAQAAKNVKAPASAKKVLSAKNTNAKRGGKKGKASVAVDPEIAFKSVDEILQFIEGTSKKGKGKH